MVWLRKTEIHKKKSRYIDTDSFIAYIKTEDNIREKITSEISALRPKIWNYLIDDDDDDDDDDDQNNKAKCL